MLVASHYFQHIPAVEDLIRALRPDAIVCGMGPTAWLLPWLDQALLRDVRFFGAHDGCMLRPGGMDDLVLLDGPWNELHPGTIRFQRIIESRPKRIWIYEKRLADWTKHLHDCTKNIRQPQKWVVWQPDRVPRDAKFKLEADPPHTTSISPTGTTTLAWKLGCRRIGVIGVEMIRGTHRVAKFGPLVDRFMLTMAQQAHERGGAIWNLSPITALGGWKLWTEERMKESCGSSSEPTSGSSEPEPSACSSEASAATQPVPSS